MVFDIVVFNNGEIWIADSLRNSPKNLDASIKYLPEKYSI